LHLFCAGTLMADAKQPRMHSPTTDPTCPKCGAPLSLGANDCWLCLSPIGAAQMQGQLDRTSPSRNLADSTADPAGGFSVASLLMLFTLACVVWGVLTIARGLAIPLGIIAFIAWMRTVSTAKQKIGSSKKPTSVEVALIFIRSVGFVLLVLALLALAAVAAFFVMCLAAMGGSSNLGSTGFFIVGAVVFAAAFIGLMVRFQPGKFRWR
jgi:hypothetical protein